MQKHRMTDTIRYIIWQDTYIPRMRLLAVQIRSSASLATIISYCFRLLIHEF